MNLTLTKPFRSSVKTILALFLALFVYSSSLAISPLTPQENKSVKITIQKEEVFEFNTDKSLDAIACLTTPISLKVDDVAIEEIAKNLSQLLGKSIVISLPADPAQAKLVSTLSIDIRDVPFKDMVKFLTDQGCEVKIDDIAFSSSLLPPSTINYLVSISTVDTKVQDLVNVLNHMCKSNISISSGDVNSKVSLSLKKASLQQILETVSKQTNCQFINNPKTQ